MTGRILQQLSETEESNKARTLVGYTIALPPDGADIDNSPQEIIPANGDRFVVFSNTAPIAIFGAIGHESEAGKGLFFVQGETQTRFVSDGKAVSAVTAGGMARLVWQVYERPSE